MSFARLGYRPSLALRNFPSVLNPLPKSTTVLSISPARPILSTYRPNTEVLSYSTEIPNKSDAKNETNTKEDKLGGFAKALQRFSTPDKQPEEEEKTFLQLLKNSKFIDLGDPEGKIVTGTIFHVVDDDLYVDFGWKFHCVVSRPAKNPHEYVRGARVRLSLKDLELSSRFLGSDKDLTLLEADAVLVGLVSSPAKGVSGVS